MKNSKKIKTKKCSACKNELPLSEFYQKKRREFKAKSQKIEIRIGYRSICKKCEPKVREKYFREYSKKYKQRAYVKKRNRKYKARKDKIEVLNLSDNYLKRLLARYSILKETEIPFEMIEAKRQQMILKRELKKLNKGD